MDSNAASAARRAGAWVAATGALIVALAASLAPFGVSAGPVNVNAADAATLARELQGIGPAKAEAIVAHREKHGPFRSAEDLSRVKGIGAKTVDRNRDFLRFDARAAGGPAAASAARPAAAASTKTVPRR
jgi:competence protein ComEA